MSRPRAIIEHGFNVRDKGAGSIDQIIPSLEAMGFEVIQTDRGWRGLLGVRLATNKRAEKLAALPLRPGDLLIGHSDGCNIINRATHHLSSLGSERVKVVYFNPALDADTPLSPIVEKALVFYTPSDWIVGLASHLWWHDWGAMGRDGFKPKNALEDDPRYTQVSYEQIGIHRPGHSGVFKDPASVMAALLTLGDWLEEM